MTTGQYRICTTVVDHGTMSTTASGPATISGSATEPISRATMNSRKASSRVLTMPRTPSRPYMTVMVSMKTFTAREPDQTAIRKPREITSGRAALGDVPQDRLRDLPHAPVGQDRAGGVEKVALHALDGVRAGPGVDVAEQADQAEQQRGHRQQREERRLGRQAQDAVLHARVDGVLEQQPGGPAFGDVPVQGAGPVEATGGRVGDSLAGCTNQRYPPRPAPLTHRPGPRVRRGGVRGRFAPWQAARTP